jgi:hypothetical protein
MLFVVLTSSSSLTRCDLDNKLGKKDKIRRILVAVARLRGESQVM